MMNNMFMHDYFDVHVNFAFLKRNRLAVGSWPLGDTNHNLVFVFFLMNYLAMMNTRQATQVKLTRFWCFSCFGRILIGEKSSS